LYYPRDSARAASRNDISHRIKQKIDIRKWLVWILRSVNGIHSLLNVLKGITYNIAFFIGAVVIPSLIKNITQGVADARRKDR
jgi:hypothetical protein